MKNVCPDYGFSGLYADEQEKSKSRSNKLHLEKFVALWMSVKEQESMLPIDLRDMAKVRVARAQVDFYIRINPYCPAKVIIDSCIAYG